MSSQIDRMNREALARLAAFFDENPAAIDAEMMAGMTEGGMAAEEAYALLLASLCGIDPGGAPRERELYHRWFLPMVRQLDARAYEADPYYANIRIPPAREGRWSFQRQRYRPYEAFVCGDLQSLPDGRVLPQIGFFDREFAYPAVLEDGREWMLITPNEIETMRPAVRAARGRVLAYGLGLGYFAYMAARKEDVTSVTVVERDAGVLELFRRHVLPQFPRADKLSLVEADAFSYAGAHMGDGRYDVVFTDLWHDPSDGVELYLRMRAMERLSPGSRFVYWIEDTLRYYL